MDDLIDRLAEVRPRPSRNVDLDGVRARVSQRRRRRRAGIGVVGAAVLLVGGLGVSRLVADGGEREVESVGPVTTVPPPATLGEEREVASGPMPGGGEWTFVVSETADGLCGRIETDSVAGDCFSAPPYDETLNVMYSDGRANGGLLFVRAVVAPEVATVRISLAGASGNEPVRGVVSTTMFVDPTDVGLPLDFVFTPLPDGAVVTSVEALDADGEVMATADGYGGPPD